MSNFDFDFFKAINSMSNFSDEKLYKDRVKELTKFVLNKHNAYYAYRLAIELDRKNFSTNELEDHIINISISNVINNNRYLFMMALNVRGSNIKKLQQAVINTKNPDLMAEFCCFVKGCDADLLEKLIIDHKIPRASYIIIRFLNNCQIDKHKKILIKSRKSRYLYACALKSNSIEELRIIEDLIIKNRSHYYVRLMATLPNADIEKLENRIIASENFEEIRKMYQITKTSRLAKYVLLM